MENITSSNLRSYLITHSFCFTHSFIYLFTLLDLKIKLKVYLGYPEKYLCPDLLPTSGIWGSNGGPGEYFYTRSFNYFSNFLPREKPNYGILICHTLSDYLWFDFLSLTRDLLTIVFNFFRPFILSHYK